MSKKIRVEFYDADSGAGIGYDEIKLHKLPNLEAEAAVVLEGKRYTIVHADPKTDKELRKEKFVRLDIRAEGVEVPSKREPEVRVETEVPPAAEQPETPAIAEVPVEHSPAREAPVEKPAARRFPLPTLCKDLPKRIPGSSKEGHLVHELHWDFWLECEFVHSDREAEIDRELLEIEKVLDSRDESGSFAHVHLRESIADALGDAGSVEELKDAFAGAGAPTELAFTNEKGLIEGGFALRMQGGRVLYGVQSEGKLQLLGLNMKAAGSINTRDLAAFMQRHSLVLLHWNSARKIPADADALSAFLTA